MDGFFSARLDQIGHERSPFRDIFFDGLLGNDDSWLRGTNRMDPLFKA